MNLPKMIDLTDLKVVLQALSDERDEVERLNKQTKGQTTQIANLKAENKRLREMSTLEHGFVRASEAWKKVKEQMGNDALSKDEKQNAGNAVSK